MNLCKLKTESAGKEKMDFGLHVGTRGAGATPDGLHAIARKTEQRMAVLVYFHLRNRGLASVKKQLCLGDYNHNNCSSIPFPQSPLHAFPKKGHIKIEYNE